MNEPWPFSPDLDSPRRVLLALREARARLEAAERAVCEPIAIVGCRFPGGANGPDAYWRLLREGVAASREMDSLTRSSIVQRLAARA